MFTGVAGNAADPDVADAQSQASKLDAVANQLVALASALRADSSKDGRNSLPASRVTQTIADREQLRALNADLAREIYANRRNREGIFGNPELFGEPAWDILLDLYIAHVEGKPVSVSSACIGSAAPPTTGLRWLGVLAEHDLVLREHDPEDQRRVLVRLTEQGLEAMDAYFAGAAGPA